MTDPQAPPFPIHAAGRERDATGAELGAADDEQTRFVLELFERYQASLMRYLSGLLSRRADAEDIVQETPAPPPLGRRARRQVRERASRDRNRTYAVPVTFRQVAVRIKV